MCTEFSYLCDCLRSTSVLTIPTSHDTFLVQTDASVKEFPL